MNEMKKFTLLRTAVGSPVAPFLLKNIKVHFKCTIIGTDIDRLACGFKFCDKQYIVPRVNDPKYVEYLLDICKKEKVDLFWPDLDEELLIIAKNTEKFEEIGVKVMLSDKEVLAVCTDKYKTYKFFEQNSIPVPATILNSLDAPKLSFPFIIKPVIGRGSQGVYIIRDENDFKFYSSKLEDFVIQELLIGAEYTIDTMSDGQGNFMYCSIRERIATDSGISVKGRTVYKPEIENYVAKSCSLLKLKGPGCFQCIEEENGRIGFIEINPRIAGTVALSVLAGAPIIVDSINAFMGIPLKNKINYKLDYYLSRYWAEESFDLN